MPDLLTGDDWNPISVEIGSTTMSSPGVWRVGRTAGDVQHAHKHGGTFDTITFPNRLINGEYSAHVTVDHKRLQTPRTATRMCFTSWDLHMLWGCQRSFTRRTTNECLQIFGISALLLRLC